MKEKRLRRKHAWKFKLECVRQIAMGQEAPGADLSEEQLHTGRASEVETRIRSTGRGSFHREAALRGRSPGAEGRQVGGIRRQARPGERDLKKGAGQIPLHER